MRATSAFVRMSRSAGGPALPGHAADAHAAIASKRREALRARAPPAAHEALELDDERIVPRRVRSNVAKHASSTARFACQTAA